MMNIGVVILGEKNIKASLNFAKALIPFATMVGRKAYGTTFELINIEEYIYPISEELVLSNEGHQKLSEKDGYLFVTPTFSGEMPEVYRSFFNVMYKDLENKSALLVAFGNEEYKDHALNQLKLELLQHQVALPANELFIERYDFVEWEIRTRIEEYITGRLNQFLLWTMAMRYARNLKERLV